MIIRSFQESERQTLEQLTLKIWAPVFARMQETMNLVIYKLLVPDWEAEQLRSIDVVCTDAATEILVAEQEGEMVGFVAIKSRPEDFLGEIFMIGVDPERQQEGIGSELMQAGLEHIKASGFTLAMVQTGGDPAHESARKTYEGMGFELWPLARYFKVLED